MKEIGKIISFQNTHHSKGFHTKVEDFKDVPFDIKRTYWTYDIPAGAARTCREAKTGRLSSEPP
mgnify:CR=1 FL=1